MALPFDPREEFIAVPMRVFGPNGELILRFLLDTGSTSSLLSWDAATRLGYEPDALSNRVQTITASRMEVSHRIVIEK
ncbi:MAG TPA: retropepsin-like aspartic protease, partial [Chloroflexia bacterium]|nr:retropepsin-like aspartic protease [Chloroflexia bacterium]